MTDSTWGNVYTRLGARPVINATGNQTTRGGSTPSPLVRQAMEEASSSYVEMDELLEKSGDHIASLLGVEAAYVTAGCYAAMVLSSATAMTYNDPDKRDQLPDTTGLKNELIFQKNQRYGYDRAYTVPGSKLVIVGDDDGCTPKKFENAIGPNTAGIIYLVQAESSSGVSLREAIEIAHRNNVIAIGDAAARIYPLDYFRRNAQSADLVCFGGKYFNAPHSTGFVVGKKHLIEEVRAHGFIGPRPIGRGMKVDRQEIIGLVTAVDAWCSMDHEKRSREQDARYADVSHALEGISGVSTEVVYNEQSHTLSNLHITFEPKTVGKNAQDVADALDVGTPRIRVAT
ncbi:MAG: aminotransferase class V-fold PLP-dependent enzyme, partial [Candidatus Poribacteria bacterium]|nr:aminotransferase class V-fold PLP-dependent enzyme [Candidatus Poribacteria bacterium]